MDHHEHKTTGRILDSIASAMEFFCMRILVPIFCLFTLCSLTMILLRHGLGLDTAKAQALVFGTELAHAPAIHFIDVRAPVDYKTQRVRDIRAIISKEFPEMEKYTDLLIAHLYSENGAMNEDSITDHGCSFGLLQWNACAHYGMSASAYLTKHPEMKAWDAQVRFYLADMQDRIAKYGSIDAGIGSWNPAAYDREIWRAHQALAFVQSCYN